MKVLVFIKKTNGKVKRVEVYGSLRKMHEAEQIKIKGELLKEHQLYSIFANATELETKDFIIRQKELKRSKRR